MRYAALIPLVIAGTLAVGVMSASGVSQGDYRLQKVTAATLGKQLKLSRSGHAALVTPDGMLVLFGGTGAAMTAQSIEIIHP